MIARDTLRTWGPSILDVALIFIGFVLDHYDILESWFSSAYPIMRPLLFTALGAVLGYTVCKALDRKLLSAKEAEIEKIRRDCERRVFEATMPLDRTIRLTKPQAEVVVGMIDRERAGEDTVLSARRGGDAALDSLAAQGVLHKEPFGSFHNMFNYAMDHEWLSLFRKHESEVRDIAAR